MSITNPTIQRVPHHLALWKRFQINNVDFWIRSLRRPSDRSSTWPLVKQRELVEVGKELFIDAIVDTHGRPDVLIVTPPRAGMHKYIVALSPERFVYIHCNSQTQGRDLG